jgi:hypothetical protein
MSDCVSLYTNPMFSRCESLCGLVFFRLNYSAFGLAILLLGCSLYLSYYCDRRSMWWNGDEIRPWSIGSDTIVLVQSSPAPMGHVGNSEKQRRRRFVLGAVVLGFHQRREGRPNPTETNDTRRCWPAETFCMSTVFIYGCCYTVVTIVHRRMNIF